jgi:Domain of unknown function (DUF202)
MFCAKALTVHFPADASGTPGWQDVGTGVTTPMANHTTRSAPQLDTATKLAYDRTRLAYENTMMSWVRTATSLMTFGFSVFKFF